MANYQDKQVKQITEKFGELDKAHQQQLLDQIKYNGALKAAERLIDTGVVCFGDLYPEALERQKSFNKFEGKRCGLRYFDDATMGFRPGELIVIAAPSNLGKTMIGLNIAVNFAVTNAEKVLIVSLEMTPLQIAGRLFNMHDDHDTMMENVIIQQQLRVSSGQIDTMIKTHRPGLVVVDHIQFLALKEEASTDYERLNLAVANLHTMAAVNQVPIIAISHVAKTRSGKDGQADANDIKGTANIEQDADIGFILNRTTEQRQGGEFTIKCFKQRDKHPTVMHRECTMNLDGVKLRDKGNYVINDEPERMQNIQAVDRIFSGKQY